MLERRKNGKGNEDSAELPEDRRGISDTLRRGAMYLSLVERMSFFSDQFNYFRGFCPQPVGSGEKFPWWIFRTDAHAMDCSDGKMISDALPNRAGDHSPCNTSTPRPCNCSMNAGSAALSVIRQLNSVTSAKKNAAFCASFE